MPPTFFHNSTLPRAVSAGVPTQWPSALLIPYASAVTSTPLSRSSTFKKAFDSCWVEATLVRLFDFGVTGRLWHLLANFLCGTMSQMRLGGSVSSPWVDSGIAQGRILSPLLFNLFIDCLAVTLRSAIPGVSLAVSDSFRHVCQLYADDLVVLTASQVDLQLALDAVHAWGVRWRFSCGVGSTNSATMVFGPLRGRPDCCVHPGGVPLPLVQQYRYLGVVLSPSLSWRPHVDFLCSRGDRLFHQASACALVRVSRLYSWTSPPPLPGDTYEVSSLGLGLGVPLGRGGERCAGALFKPAFFPLFFCSFFSSFFFCSPLSSSLFSPFGAPPFGAPPFKAHP